jgi:hypothetical protein
MILRTAIRFLIIGPVSGEKGIGCIVVALEIDVLLGRC